MKPVRPALNGLKIGASGLFALGLLSGLAAGAQAEFGSPPGQGTPKGTAGGGSRAPAACLTKPPSNETLAALAPTQFVGRTTQANPTVWVYLPKTPAKTLEFSLFPDQEDDGIYQVDIPVKSAGLLKITLPTSVSLAAGKSYYWTVALICDPNRRMEDWIVGGWIQHEALATDRQQQLRHATPAQQIEAYVQLGFWYDALNTYLALRQAQPAYPNLAQLQADLFKAADLSAIAEPLSMTSQTPNRR